MWKILQKYNDYRTILVTTDAQLQTGSEIIMALGVAGGFIFGGLKMLWNKGKSKQKNDDEIKYLQKENADLSSELQEVKNDLQAVKEDISEYRKEMRDTVEEIKINQATIIGKLDILVKNKTD